MSAQPELYPERTMEIPQEKNAYLTEQLITYIGNKRALLDFLADGLNIVRTRLGKDRLSIFDVFSGSGVVSRFFKRFASELYVNDLEKYSAVINECYLTNESSFNHSEFGEIYGDVLRRLETEPLEPGFITELYAPRDDDAIGPGERVFYTTRNAKYLDTACRLIEPVPAAYRKYLTAPLLSEASVHANTSGVFKGFYKDRETGLGQFGGRNRDALCRIMGDIRLPYPVFSNFTCDCHVYNEDSNLLCAGLPEVDVAYLDPPYNQHPYGSNYFMLNLLVEYKRPAGISEISGIPDDWNRSPYNKPKMAYLALSEMVEKLNAKFLLISFNSEGFISLGRMMDLLGSYGKITVLETRYNTFRGSRNLSGRDIHVREYLYLLEKT